MELVMKSKPFRDAEREQTSILAPLERAALRGLARRMPGWVNSDHLSVLGLVGMLGAGVCYAASKQNPLLLHLVNLFIFLNWFGDSLDGTLARYRERQRPRYGFYVDHMVDSLGALALMGGLALSRYMHPYIAIGLLIAFLLLSIQSYLATHALGEFRLAFWRFGPTELRILLAIGNVALLFRAMVHSPWGVYRLFDVGGAIGLTGMMLMLLVWTGQNTVRLYRIETTR